MTNEPVLVDTSYWIEYFNRPRKETAIAVETLVREDRSALTAVILADLPQGPQMEEELTKLRSALAAVSWVETTSETYSHAGRLGFGLRHRGMTVPITGCVVAAATESIGGRLLTLDDHFQELAQAASLILLQKTDVATHTASAQRVAVILNT